MYSDSLLLYVCCFVWCVYGYRYNSYDCSCQCSCQGGSVRVEKEYTISESDPVFTCLDEVYFDLSICSIAKISCNELIGCCYYDRFDTYYITCDSGPSSWCSSSGRPCNTENCECEPVLDQRPDTNPGVQPGDRDHSNRPATSPATSPVTSPTTSPAINPTTSATQSPEKNKLTIGITIGVGIGVGITFLLLAFVGLLLFCRRQGVKQDLSQERNKARDLPMISSATTRTTGEYAEIGNTYHTVSDFNSQNYTEDPNLSTPSNREYTPLSKPDNPTITSRYESLKKPDEDLGHDEYTDPEKYTEPPNSANLNSEVKGQDVTDDDYVKPETDATREYFTLEPPTPSQEPQSKGDYVDVDLPESRSDSEQPESENRREYFTLEPPTPAKEPQSQGDYVDVDLPESQSESITKQPESENTREYFTLEPPTPAKEPQSQGDYVDVDLPESQSESITKQPESENTREYFTLEPPTPANEPQSQGDYVDVDLPESKNDPE
ncbi:uncharacterized protein [Amphiura filiformis]|uniref:uncharacterized protein isoform X2 n=1 Tax=Amphiura filiformis TaxID=82378 RepID=UPI003B20DB66